jgi:hypothetical protein
VLLLLGLKGKVFKIITAYRFISGDYSRKPRFCMQWSSLTVHNLLRFLASWVQVPRSGFLQSSTSFLVAQVPIIFGTDHFTAP